MTDMVSRKNKTGGDQVSADSLHSERSHEKDLVESPENAGGMKALFRMGMQSFHGQPQDPLLEKFESEHVHKFLDYLQRDDDNAFYLAKSNRWFHLVYTILGLGFFLFLIFYLLPVDKSLLLDLIKIIVIFAGGFGSGFGLKSYLDKRK